VQNRLKESFDLSKQGNSMLLYSMGTTLGLSYFLMLNKWFIID